MRDLHQAVTDQILAELKAGAVPWVRPWSETPGLNVPCNAVTGRQYHGVNVLLLWLTRSKGWATPRFLTFKQALELGGHVRKGEHGSKVYFVKDLKFAEQTAEGEDTVRAVRMLREYTVFNIDQCDGLPAHVTKPALAPRRNRDGRDELIDEFVATTGACIKEDGVEATFLPSRDVILMPPFASFKDAASFYNTEFHELAHWTGHLSRLDRKLGERFGARTYAAEELIAELSAAFLCAEFNIDCDLRAAGYISEYIQLLENDNRAIFTAASKAQEVVDYERPRACGAKVQQHGHTR